MDDSSKGKDFSHENSRKFEELVLKLFELEFNLHDNDILLTQMTHDGGKDVEILFEHNSASFSPIDYKVWVEAKLKKKSKKVKLNDIAGNVIIAFNSNIRAIYFITTTYFSPQTYEVLMLTKFKTGLKITLIDGFNLRAILNKWDNELNKSNEFNEFISELKKFIPIEKNKQIENIVFKIDNTTMEITASANKEKEIISQKIDFSPVSKSDEKYDLSLIKTDFSVNQEDIENNLLYKLTGERRKYLFNEIVNEIQNFRTIVLTGEMGQGKTFLTQHIIRHFQNENWITLPISVSNDNIISFTKKLLLNFINLDYSDLEENYDVIIKCISVSFNVDLHVAKQIIKVLESCTLSENIAPEICLELLKKSLANCSKRQCILLVIDDLDCVEIELFSFLLNFFNYLKNNRISVITTIKPIQSDCNYKENEKLSKYSRALNIQEYSQFTLLPLDDAEENELIEGMLPGINMNTINLIKKNTLPIPLYIQIFIEYLIRRKIIVSKDKKHWILNDTSVLIDNSEIQSNKISTLIIQLLNCYFENKSIEKASIYLYLFNNRLADSYIKMLVPEWDEDEMCRQIFVKFYSESQAYIKFRHILFYENLPFVLEHSSEILRSYAENLLNSEQSKDFDNAVKGKLFEHAGLFQDAYKAYLSHGDNIWKVDPHEAMVYYEKALKNFLATPGSITDYNDYTSLLCELAFKILLLYNKYNFLHTKKAERLYSVLTRYQNSFSLNNILYYYYYMGQRETKQENFEEAHKYYTKAKQEIFLNYGLPEDIVVRIINAYGISLKHLGLRTDSIAFFEEASEKWNYKSIQIEKNFNLVAYYLTIDPSKSLEYLYLNQNEFSYSSVHLDVDIAMVNFYIGEYDKAEEQLQKAIVRAKDSINLSEEARALNIMGLLKWLKNNYVETENYLDSALVSGELANNHRWIWRIWGNIAQISCVNKNNDKAYNIVYALINHIDKTKHALIRELKDNSVNSRRYAALKAAFYVLFKLQKIDEINELIDSRFVEIKEQISSFYKKLNDENVTYDDKDDANFYSNNKAYFILG
jgi:TPR repeat protein